MIAGANRDDYHLRNVTLGEDFQAEIHDLRQVVAGDLCGRCGGPIEVRKTVEIGHIFKLGYKYSESMGLRVLNADGKEITPIMGSYGIGIERILSAAIELYHDKDGMILPPTIAPFQVVVTPANFSDAAQGEAARAIYQKALTLGLDALLDDRDERPGVKFKDADLIGIPFRIVVGKKLSAGMVELVDRKTRQSVDVAVADAASAVAQRFPRVSQN
jgi:prolyl-tRNA synthetase